MPNGHSPDSPVYDVIIAGAGPVGLFLACELRLAGCSTLVLEQADHPFARAKVLPFGMRGLSAPSLDAFDRRGLLDELAALRIAGSRMKDDNGVGTAHWMLQPRRPGGHFAGIPFLLENVDAASWPYRLPHQVDTTMSTDMASVEAVLSRRADALGVEIRRGHRIDDVATSGEAVTIRAGEARFHARWLVGCDGGRSTVRKRAGFDFVGTDPEFTGYSVEIEMDDPDALLPGRHYTPAGMYSYQKPGIIAMVDFDGGRFHRTESITREHVQSVLRKIAKPNVTVTALHFASTWTDRAYQATSYRTGRVLLAGDAAHTHSPLGGQGLNLGLGDAMNLGWKLAATIRGDAPAALLDSYFAERHPAGARVLDWSRAQVAIMRPSPSSRALEAILRDLIDTRDGATYMAERVWGLSQQYDFGAEHPLVGRSAPDFRITDGRRLAEILRNGKGALLDFDSRRPLQTVVGRWADRITYVTGCATHDGDLRAVLVRPDGHVAWAQDAASADDDLVPVLARWFG